MKKIITLFLALILLCSLLTACGGGTDVDLSGTWEAVYYYDSESVLAELENLDFYEEEIALMDLSTMGFCEVLQLNADMTYTLGCDAIRSRELVEEFYQAAFADLYENREQLQDIYEEDFVSMTEDEFRLFYANMYGASTFESLMYMFAGTADDYAHLEEGNEAGTYRVMLNRIFFTVDGSTEEEYVTFTLGEDGALTLEFTDSTVTYTKTE